MVGHILFYERVSDHTANVIEYLKIARDDTEFTFSHSWGRIAGADSDFYLFVSGDEVDPDEDVSLPAMSALISRFRDSLLFNFCIVVQSVYLPVFLCGGCCMLLMLLYHIIVYLQICYGQLQSRSESWSKQRSGWWLRGGISRVLGLEFAKHPAERWLDRTNGSSTSELRVLLVQYVNREAWHFFI